jgi:hypothetical protein
VNDKLQEAEYDNYRLPKAGARTILSWSYNGAESHSYRSVNPTRSWNATLEGFRRVKSMERDRILAENRKKYMK